MSHYVRSTYIKTEMNIERERFMCLCFQVPEDEVTEISEATEPTDATDISEASDQDNNKKVHITAITHRDSL